MAEATLTRKTFTVSRLAEFVSESELVKQIGHPVADWPLVILKELVDNALDEAEDSLRRALQFYDGRQMVLLAERTRALLAGLTAQRRARTG